MKIDIQVEKAIKKMVTFELPFYVKESSSKVMMIDLHKVVEIHLVGEGLFKNQYRWEVHTITGRNMAFAERYRKFYQKLDSFEYCTKKYFDRILKEAKII